jgi:hypothetical protein
LREREYCETALLHLCQSSLELPPLERIAEGGSILEASSLLLEESRRLLFFYAMRKTVFASYFLLTTL